MLIKDTRNIFFQIIVNIQFYPFLAKIKNGTKKYFLLSNFNFLLNRFLSSVCIFLYLSQNYLNNSKSRKYDDLAKTVTHYSLTIL